MKCTLFFSHRTGYLAEPIAPHILEHKFSSVLIDDATPLQEAEQGKTTWEHVPQTVERFILKFTISPAQEHLPVLFVSPTFELCCVSFFKVFFSMWLEYARAWECIISEWNHGCYSRC
jgi:hypothetical protein